MRLILHWPWWELNSGPPDLEDSVLTTIPLRLYLNLSVTMLYMNMDIFIFSISVIGNSTSIRQKSSYAFQSCKST